MLLCPWCHECCVWAYIAQTLFYYGNHTWLVPTAISTSDEKVVQLRSELAGAKGARDRPGSLICLHFARTDR